ncbi:hypothetical protein Ppa06_59700 [Planomonospora parontospora subsp. parontospora]|uniref:Uncharacterized protein n=2 Tax=Planomonospora parontospora TaxID=58119 RepID=A0AA37BMN4_9ACTN|nr:hypothetical protein [Planomonospora parontospora]GGK92051.1 hypothetical protein GCM10010126_59250 [Planomonospora parontospora]GII12172.1 hypothetical protein Ppa06_59700 [Planomonospora parontospora subsp. parontospora]
MKALLGEGAAFAARQAAVLFALAAGLAAATAVPPSTHFAPLVVIGAAALALAVIAWLLPWDRFDARWPLVLTVPALCLLAAAIWAHRGVAGSTAPFFMLLFAWVGLHFSMRAVLVLALPAAVTYLAPADRRAGAGTVIRRRPPRSGSPSARSRGQEPVVHQAQDGSPTACWETAHNRSRAAAS